MNKNSKIYIAGHTGMIGSAIVRKFKANGYFNLLLKTHRQLELSDQKAVSSFFKKEQPEYVILAAGKVGGVKSNLENPAEFLYENLQIQNNVIWAAHLWKVKKLLFLGSASAYPEDSPQPIKEEYLLSGKLERTKEAYGLAKIAGIKLCEKISEEYNQIFFACLPNNVYGENDNFDSQSAHVTAALIYKLHQAKLKKIPEVKVIGSSKTKREFLYVDDLAQAILLLMEKYNEKEYINVGTGIDVTIGGLSLKIKKIVGYRGRINFESDELGSSTKRLLDIKKIRKLGWWPKVNLDNGLKLTYQSYLKYADLKKIF